MRLIDADKLREAVITDYYEHFTGCHDTDQIALIDMVCDDIEEAPTIEVPRWIPVTERLPTDEDANEYGYVLGFDKNENYAIWHKSHFENHPEWFTHWTNLLDAPKDGE